MKKLHFVLSLSILIVAIFTISCNKEDFKSTLGVDIPVSASSVGSIVDLGVIDGEIRNMITTANTQSFTIMDNSDPVSGTSSQISGSSSQIKVSYYVDKDAYIPDGIYVYSNSGSKRPFTFDSAVITDAHNIDGTSIASEDIEGGSISVSRTDTIYFFDFQLQLASGKTFTGSSNSSFTYTDLPN